MSKAQSAKRHLFPSLFVDTADVWPGDIVQSVEGRQCHTQERVS